MGVAGTTSTSRSVERLDLQHPLSRPLQFGRHSGQWRHKPLGPRPITDGGVCSRPHRLTAIRQVVDLDTHFNLVHLMLYQAPCLGARVSQRLSVRAAKLLLLLLGTHAATTAAAIMYD